jgi:hypothetical protein
MDAWFEDLVEDVIWEAIQDWFGDLKGKTSEAIHAELDKLEKGKRLSESPLVAVIAKDDESVTLLVRGRFKIFGGAIAPFIRLQVKVSKTVNTALEPSLTIDEWQTVVGDLQIKQEGVFTAELAFGYDQEAWLGRGAFKVLPAGFGLDLLLGGLNKRGLMVGIDGHLPSPIPLGSSGAVLTGVGGDFAYNFIPRLNKGAWQATPWDARDYVKWARDDEHKGPDRWVQNEAGEHAVGIGLHGAFGDLPTLGWMLSLDPIGLALLTPGPVFILGGKGKLINTDGITAEGYAAVDIPSESIALGLSLGAQEPVDGKFKFLEAKGSLDAFFAFGHPDDWYIRFGTRTSPVKATVMSAIEADVFLMLGHGAVPVTDGADHAGIFFGLGVAYGDKWTVAIVTVTARIGARGAAGVGWDPLELEGSFGIYGELKLEIWKFRIRVVLQTDLTGYLAKPTLLTGDVGYHLGLPWPLDDIEGTIAYTIGDSGGDTPHLKSPLLVGSEA